MGLSSVRLVNAEVKCGVLQGSTTGPFLFLLCVYDIVPNLYLTKPILAMTIEI